MATQETKTPRDELQDLSENSTAELAQRIFDMGRAILGRGDLPRARAALAALLGETLALADLIGRRRLLLEADSLGDRQPEDLRGRMLFADQPRALPRVPFPEAIRDLVSREPRLENDWRRVAQIYREQHAFALARSTEIQVTERIQRSLGRMLREGATMEQAERRIMAAGAQLDGFTRAYAETVYRTNLNSAYHAGRWEEAKDPDVQAVIGAWEFWSLRDVATRPNHEAAHGLIASQFDPIWDLLSPPLGFNCRCSLRLVGKERLRDLKLVDSSGRVSRLEPATLDQAHPDEGFGPRIRPDQRFYR